MTLLILGQKDLELKPIFRSMLSLLLISDTICIILINIIFTCKLLSLDFAIYILPHIIPWLLPITQIFLTISVYTTIGVAVERFVSISTHTPPRRVRPSGDIVQLYISVYFQANSNSGRLILSCVIVFSMIINISR